MGVEAGTWASRLAFRPQDWDLGLKTRIWASRLGFEAEGQTEEEEEEEKEKKKKLGKFLIFSLVVVLPRIHRLEQTNCPL